jgi:hypothetical protein
MNSTTSKVAPPREWLSLKQLQRYSHLPEKIIREWIQRPVEPLPVTRLGATTLIRRSTFDRWLASNKPAAAELSSHFKKEPSGDSFLSLSSLCRDGRDAMAWLASNNFASLAEAWDSCEWGEWMLWMLERINPLTEEQWEELERALKPFWVKRLEAQSPAETEQAFAEYELGKARALRQIVGNPWRSQNEHTSD